MTDGDLLDLLDRVDWEFKDWLRHKYNVQCDSRLNFSQYCLAKEKYSKICLKWGVKAIFHKRQSTSDTRLGTHKPKGYNYNV